MRKIILLAIFSSFTIPAFALTNLEVFDRVTRLLPEQEYSGFWLNENCAAVVRISQLPNAIPTLFLGAFGPNGNQATVDLYGADTLTAGVQVLADTPTLFSFMQGRLTESQIFGPIVMREKVAISISATAGRSITITNQVLGMSGQPLIPEITSSCSFLTPKH